MKTLVLLLAIALVSRAGWSQNSSLIEPPTPAPRTNGLGSNTINSTNQNAQAHSPEQLTEQLRLLRSAIEETLPALSAITESSTGSHSLGGSLSNLMSGVLNRSTNQNSGRWSPALSNIVGVLGGTQNTNSSGGVSLDPNTVQKLVTLRNELQPILPLLDSLNIAGISTNSEGSQVISAPATNQSGRPLTPTGP